MKLLGTVNSIERTVAKRDNSGKVIDEKTKFSITVRPVNCTGVYDYGYGKLVFQTHGMEVVDLGIDLDDAIDLILVKSGETYEGYDIEDLKRKLLEVEKRLSDASAISERNMSNLRRERDENRDRAMNKDRQVQALQLEAVRLSTELLTLKTIMSGGEMVNKAIGQE